MKILKIYLFNCPSSCDTQIYCIKHDSSEDLAGLKEKIYLRCPVLRTISHDPQIYWFDLENDRIMITCDDDLRFFLEESSVTKLIVDYGMSHETSRKRHLVDEECSESSKKIRKKLQQIDLDSDSTMDADNLEDLEYQGNSSNVTSTFKDEEPVASTSQANVEIINVEIIKPADKITESDTNECQNEENSVENCTTEVIEGPVAERESTRIRIRPLEPGKIVISDSSDEEEEEPQRNRRHSDYTSSYSFAGVNNESFDSWTSFDDNFQRHHHHHRRNFRNDFNNAMRNAAAARERALRNAEHAMRNFRNPSDLFPRMLSTFQAHFRPLFRPPGFSAQQQYSRTFRY